jgi:hypothetical protein
MDAAPTQAALVDFYRSTTPVVDREVTTTLIGRMRDVAIDELESWTAATARCCRRRQIVAVATRNVRAPASFAVVSLRARRNREFDIMTDPMRELDTDEPECVSGGGFASAGAGVGAAGAGAAQVDFFAQYYYFVYQPASPVICGDGICA